MKKGEDIVKRDLRYLLLTSSTLVVGLVCVLFFSPLSSQFTDETVSRGDTWNIEVNEFLTTGDERGALSLIDSLINERQTGLPRFAYFDCYLSEDERVDATNARADIYDLQWKRIEILRMCQDSDQLVSALQTYSKVIGYNQGKAKRLLKQVKGK